MSKPIMGMWPWALAASISTGVIFSLDKAPRYLLAGWLVYQAWLLAACVVSELKPREGSKSNAEWQRRNA